MSQQPNKQELQECLSQLKQYFLLFKGECLYELLYDDQLNEHLEQLSLGNVLHIIRNFLDDQAYRQNIAEFIALNCPNIISFLFFQRNASIQDYYLLYDIIYQALKLLPQHNENCIVLIQKTIQKIDLYFRNQLIEDFLSAICMLLRIKLLGNHAFCQRDQLKSFCLNPNVNKFVIDFAMKMIKDKHIGQATNFTFFKMRIGEKAYNQWLEDVSNTKRSIIKENKQNKPKQANSQPSTGIKEKQDKQIEVLNQNVSIKEDLRGWIVCLKSYKRKNYQQDSQVKETLQKILSLRIQQMLKMNQYRELVVDLLKLSFKFSELISFSISIGAFVMDVEDFINQMRPMLDPKAINQSQAEPLKKSVRRALQESFGSQSAFIWKRLTSAV